MPPAFTSASAPLVPLSVSVDAPRSLVAPSVAVAAVAPPAVSAEAKRWFTLAIGSLVVAGLLSLSVVLGRLPVLSRIIDDPLFFKRCLVVHVDLALVVWFYAFLAALMALRTPRGEGLSGRVAFTLSVGGVFAMLAGGLVRGAQPVLANYVPVIDHPLFGAGLAAFFTGALIFFVQSLARPTSQRADELPSDVAIGLQAAALTTVIAAATWVSARAGLPAGVDAYTRAEFLAWGAGHVLQAANTAAMLAVWLWLLQRATGRSLFSPRAARGVFALVVLPQLAMPLLTVRGTLDTLYHSGATQLMRWAIFPAVVLVFALGVRHLWRHRAAHAWRPRNTTWAPVRPADPAAPVARVGFAASATLAILGMILGACIRSSTTLVPAHYHASLGAVTMAFMTAAFLVCAAARPAANGAGLSDRTWRQARWQLLAYGVGQTIFVAGFAIGGAYGLGRKAYAAEQHVRGAGEMTGLIVMGVGGLLAVAGGLWFLFLVLREVRGWWRARGAAAEFAITST